MRKTFLIIHQYLGLLTGIVVFIVSVTGCLWVFKEEIQSLYTEVPEISIQDAPVITPTQAKKIAQSVFPGKAIHGTLYSQPVEAIEVIFYEADPEFYRSVFLHPYSGNIIKTVNHDSGFFAFVLSGHMHLWMPEKIGSNVVGISVLLYLVILLTGLVLWWPKKKKNRQRLLFEWKSTTRWKRKNYDLHAIPGFYILLLAFILGFTGVVMSYDWLYKSYYRMMGGEKESQFIIPENKNKNAVLADTYLLPIDGLIFKLQQENPDAEHFEVHYPYSESASIYVEISTKDGVYYNNDYRFYDQYTLEEINTPGVYGRYEDAGLSDKILRMNYDIHVGAIGGLPGKIIAFLISFLSASMPVTGFIIWYGKFIKKKHSRKLEKKESEVLVGTRRSAFAEYK